MSTTESLYFILPIEFLPDKLIKMTGDNVSIVWKSHDGNHSNLTDKQSFITKKEGLLREITIEEYQERYNEIFTQFIEEKNERAKC